MNLFKYVTGYLMGSGGSESLVQISGSLYDWYKGSWRCLFNDCAAVVRKSNRAFVYDLIISRVESDDVPDEEEEQDHVFTISEGMTFAKDVGPVTNGYSWTDTATELEDEGNMSSLFQLTVCQCIYEAKNNKSSTDVPADSVLHFCGVPPQITATPTKSPLNPSLKEMNAPTTPISPFNHSSQTTPQHTPQKTSSQTPQQTPSQIPQQTPSQTPQKTPSQTPQKTPQQTKSPAAQMSQQKQTPQNFFQRTPQSTIPQQVPHTTPQHTPQKSTFLDKLETSAPSTPQSSAPTQGVHMEGETNIKIPSADLFVFDTTSNAFTLKQQNVEVMLNDTSDEEVFASFKGQVIIGSPIDADMHPHFHKEERSFVWTYTQGNLVWTWSLQFSTQKEEEQFKETFATALWEVNNNAPFKNKGDELEYLMNALSDDAVAPNDISLEKNDGTVDEVDLLEFDTMNLNEEEEEEEEEEDEEEEEEEDEDEEAEVDSDSDIQEFNSHSKNSALAVGTQSDRSYVVRGSRIGVFKTDENLKLMTSIQKIKDKEGKFFSPKKLVLSEQDQSLLMLHPDQKNKLFKMDLNRSDIIEEWKVSDYYPVSEVVPTTKYAQTTPAKTVVGMNDIGFFLIDPRLNKEKMVDSKSYFYSGDTKPLLSCAATTDTGAVVVGTKRGDIRLFDSKTFGDGRHSAADSLEARRPRAKTTLPGLGDPIVGIDVTEDGRWILATCRTYIIVIPTDLPNGNTGFEKPMGKFKLKNEDIVKLGGRVSFTVAHFNTKDPTNLNAAPERSIVTSAGKYVITWNFKKVKQGILDQYNIQEYNEVVVADQFKFGEDKKVIVTLPNNVLMTKRSARKVT